MDWFSFAMGALLATSITIQWMRPHVVAALRVVRYARENGSIDGFDWENYS